MIPAIVEDLRHRMAGEEPDAGIGKSAGFEDGFEQRRDMVTEAEAVAVEQLDRIENFAFRLFVRPACDVIPEARLDEAPIREKEAPDGLGLLAWRDRTAAGVDSLDKRVEARGVGLPLF